MKTNQPQFADVTIRSLSHDLARVHFNGRLADESVHWDATIITLKHYCQQRRLDCYTQKQFIEIAPSMENDLWPITIGLKLDKLDTAAVLKTVIMVRQYKKLHPGRHEFG